MAEPKGPGRFVEACARLLREFCGLASDLCRDVRRRARPRRFVNAQAMRAISTMAANAQAMPAHSRGPRVSRNTTTPSAVSSRMVSIE